MTSFIRDIGKRFQFEQHLRHNEEPNHTGLNALHSHIIVEGALSGSQQQFTIEYARGSHRASARWFR